MSATNNTFDSNKIFPVILSGGFGKRLWPLSNKYRSKQFVKFINGKSLFEFTMLRILDTFKSFEKIIIVTSEKDKFFIYESLKQLNMFDKVDILIEPMSKNTAPAITLAADYIQSTYSDGIMAVFPSDHFVNDVPSFSKNINHGLSLINENDIVLFGIFPQEKNNNFGYIETINKIDQVNDVISFHEKPSLEELDILFKNGNIYINSGIFILKTNLWLKSIKLLSIDFYNNFISSKYSFDNIFYRANIFYDSLDSISIDNAIIENFKKFSLKLKMIKMTNDWNDCGTWKNFEKLFLSKQDNFSNVMIGNGKFLESNNNFIYSKKMRVSLIGVSNLTIIANNNELLVFDKNNPELFKEFILENFNNLSDSQTELGTEVYRPWGYYITLDEGDSYKVKKIVINPQSSLSLQKHEHRSEHWVLINGKADIISGNSKQCLIPNQSTYIEQNKLHRIENNYEKIAEIIEVQCGEKISEDDIIRVMDIYGR